MRLPEDRFYEIRGHTFNCLLNQVLPKYKLVAVQEVLAGLLKRFGALTRDEIENVELSLRTFGTEIERLADKHRYLSDKQWRAYQQGYDDGKKQRVEA
jgi:hypothetical protein